MTQEEFIEKQGKGFHLRLFKYLSIYGDKDEIKEIEEEDQVVKFDFPEGSYKIKYSLLFKRMQQDIQQLEEEKDIKIDARYKQNTKKTR